MTAASASMAPNCAMAMPRTAGSTPKCPAMIPALADTCVTIGDEDSAAKLYALLDPYADQWHVVGWGSVVFASTQVMPKPSCSEGVTYIAAC